MDKTNKNPDRLNITKKAKYIIDKIDDIRYLNLDNNQTSRSDLFTLSMAIGIETVPTKLENVYPGGLILDKSIESRLNALMYAYYISTLPNTDMLDEVTKKEYVYNLAQEYANTGFEILENYLENKKDSQLMWDLLEEMDKQYEEIISKQN